MTANQRRGIGLTEASRKACQDEVIRHLQVWLAVVAVFTVAVCLLTAYIIVHAQGQPHLVRQVCYYSDGGHRDC